MQEKGITGSGPGYYKNMSPDTYKAKINTPARNPEYFRQFHGPLIERTKQRFGSPIHVLDIACGPADELEFFKGDPDVRIIATDISPDILPHVKNKLREDSNVFVSDVNSPALKDNVAEAGILVNAMIYVPDKMLYAMYHALKPGGQCAVNFRVSSNEHNQVFYNRFLKTDGKIIDKELIVQTKEGPKTFNVRVLDSREVINDDGSPNLAIRQLGQQIHFQSINDVKELIRLVGFKQIEYTQFDFSSPSNPNDQVEVFILEKPLA